MISGGRIRSWCLMLSVVLTAVTAVAIPRSDSDVSRVLERLDKELEQRDVYLNNRRHVIDSLTSICQKNPNDLDAMMKLARTYTSFNNDSALAIYHRGYERAMEADDTEAATLFRLRRAAQLPLAGFNAEAEREIAKVDTTHLSAETKAVYYDCVRQMYSYISDDYSAYPDERQRYRNLMLDAQVRLISTLPEGDKLHQLNLGEYYYSQGNLTLSDVVLKQLLGILEETDNTYARAAHIVADISKAKGNNNDYIYYLTLSAIGDTKSATLEVTSLQDLGRMMYSTNNIGRAHNYLYTALKNAVECHAETRMLQTSEVLPVIETVHSMELKRSQRRIYRVITIMAVALVGLVVMLIMRIWQMHRMHRLHENLREANRVKEEYLRHFLSLCSIYMDKLNQFCNIANRKISTGNVEDFYKLTRSGKFVENQSKEFYDVFDDAFTHIHPGFVERVNALLRPEEQIVLEEGEVLNKDLRILALINMGINESGKIAQILNYSLNTIYTYRNKLKNKALNRDTFEEDVRNLK